jgi:exonuclease VII small subunit
MSETKNMVASWLEFEHMRKDMETKVHELELSNFNLTYGSKTEADFRQKLREVRILLEKIEALLGPPKPEPSRIS